MKKRSVCASISGENFTSVHGDMITEIFNGKTKGTPGPFRPGSSTYPETVYTWVKTIHIHSNLYKLFKSQIIYKTSSKHKETTESGKKLHEIHLKTKLKDYGINPFSNELPKCISTGVEIDRRIIEDMILSPLKGNEKYELFVKERL